MRFNTLTTFALIGTATFFAACSSSDDGPDVTAPTIVSATQNRTVDPLGFTVDIRMSEIIDPVAANLVGSWTASAGNITSATLQPDNYTVRLVLDQVSVPGNVTFGAAAGVAATGNIDLTAQVTDGDTVTVSDGTNAYTFEFTSGGGATAPNIEVDKGASATDAIAAFITAFNNVADFNITAAAGAGDSADLTNDNLGDDGNVAITETDAGGVITLTGMTGGTGIKDSVGNVIDTPIAGITLTSSELVPPSVTSIAGNTRAGFDNDQFVVVFNDDMVQSLVENPANWTFEAPIGTTFDATGATFSYDTMTRTATVTFVTGVPGAAGGNSNNLQTFDSVRATFANLTDVSGNALATTPFDGFTGGDFTPPTFDSVWSDGVADSVTVRFSEPVKAFAFADRYDAITNIDGPRFRVIDADATPAAPSTGSITFAGDPVDGETFTINDGTNTDIYEFESAGGVTPGNISIAITAGNNNQMAADTQTAIAGGTVNITAANAAAACNLTHNVAGAAGNIAITGTVTNVTIAGMTGGTDDVAGFYTLEATNFAFSPDNTGLLVDIDSAPTPGSDSIELYGFEDLAGNQVFAQANFPVIAEDANSGAIDAGNSAVTAFAGADNDEIVVHFDRNMSSFNITDPSNYSAAPLDLSTAYFEFNGTDEVTIELDGLGSSFDVQFGTNYNLTLIDNAATPFYTSQGVELVGNDVQVIAGDGDNVAIATATAYVGPAANPNTCILEFPEAPNFLGATTLTNYAIGGVNPTAITQLNENSFLLTFPTQPAAANVLDIEIAAATDLSGNPAAAQLNIALTAADATAPTASFTIFADPNTGNDYADVVFSEHVDSASAVNPANYTFTAGGFPVDLTGAEIEYDANNFTVYFDFSDAVNLQFGDTVSLAIANVADHSGNLLTAQPANTTVAGDNTDPNFFSPTSAYVNYIVDGTGLTIDVLFNEDVNEAFVETVGNWTTSGATVVQTATLLSPNHCRLTTDVQIGAGETLGLNNLPDLAGNNGGGAITVNPVE